jgi:DNA-binding MarR family transcriptional regulator
LTTNREQHIGNLFRDGLGDFERELIGRLRDELGDVLRPTHNAVLRYLDEDGTRATVLARRSGLTRQALTQIIDDLERLGVVERREDPSDRRAKLVVYTDRGRTFFRRSRDVIDAIEAEYSRRLGRERYRALKDALADLIEGR